MKKMSTYLLTLFMVMFLVFRTILCITDSMGISIGFSIPNVTTEIILLFANVFLIVLVFKRKLIGVLTYVIVHLAYYGPFVYTNLMSVINDDTVNILAYSDLLAGVIGIVLPIFALLDYLMDKNKQNHPKDKKTDWFYSNEDYDREIDERADKNNYRTL